MCDFCWARLTEQIERASSPADVRSAHEAYLDAAARHCLLLPEAWPALTLVNSILALSLSLHREVMRAAGGGGDDDAGGADGEEEEEEEGGAATTASWASLVAASSRQCALLLGSLAKEPLAPRELVLPSVIGAFDEDE